MPEAGELNPSEWLCDYDYPARRVALIRTSGPEYRHWCPIQVSPTLSDPGGAFQVWIVSGPGEQAVGTEAVKVTANLDVDGDLIAPHIDLNLRLIGSRTIWPSRSTGSLAAGYGRFVWWAQGPLWTTNPPRPWEPMAKDSDSEWLQGQLGQPTSN